MPTTYDRDKAEEHYRKEKREAQKVIHYIVSVAIGVPAIITIIWLIVR